MFVSFHWPIGNLMSFSDIVAELPCPHSGILTYEENMPSPNIVEAVKEGFDEKVLLSYQGQLYLRKHLNQLHNMFYKPDNGMSLVISLGARKATNDPTKILNFLLFIPAKIQIISNRSPPLKTFCSGGKKPEGQVLGKKTTLLRQIYSQQE